MGTDPHFILQPAASRSKAAAASVGRTNSLTICTTSDQRPAAPTATPMTRSACHAGSCEGIRKGRREVLALEVSQPMLSIGIRAQYQLHTLATSRWHM